MKNSKIKIKKVLFAFCILHFAFSICANAQETPPAPSAPKVVTIPASKEKKLANGLTVAVVERKNVPLVTVQLLVKSGASSEELEKAGLANMTAALLTKGTKTRTATQIAEQMEFLGGSINTGAGWNNSVVIVNVMSDKLDPAMTIMSDVVLNPTFKQEEINLIKSQSLDNLAYNLTQPGFLANYVSSAYSFKEHPAGGTPNSLKNITRQDIVDFHRIYFDPSDAVLIFTGDISELTANSLAQKFFGKWKGIVKEARIDEPKTKTPSGNNSNELARRILVVDLPNSGQAAVKYLKTVENGRVSYNGKMATPNTSYFPSIVLNSVLGGGYSSRLNQEIRIRQGLSYGAGSGFSWREENSNFATSTQTKNESAAKVVELVLAEVKKITDSFVSATELNPRKLVLTGDFGRDLETTQGLAAALADLYSFGLSPAELNSYMKNVQAVTDAQIRDFAKQNLMGGDIIIVGDAKIFMDDLKKRFPNMKIETVKAAELDLNKLN
jgi:zinc protease